MKNTYLASRARHGFTLIELLVVISIIALLAAILFPVFTRVREGGRRTSCANNLRQLGLAFQQYVQDNSGRYPYSGDAFTAPGGGRCFGATCSGWTKGNGHWVAGPGATTAGGVDNFLTDPTAPFAYKAPNQARPEDGAIYSYVKTPAVYVCPSNADGDKKRLTYSMNCALTLIGTARIKSPSDIVLLIDEEFANDGYFLAVNDGGSNPAKSTRDGTAATDSTDALTKKHNGGGNLLFVDGHVKFYSFDSFPLDNSAIGKANKWKTGGTPRFHDRAFGPRGSMTPPYSTPQYVTDFCNASTAPGAGGAGNEDGSGNLP